jgi:acetyl esterase/lipase
VIHGTADTLAPVEEARAFVARLKERSQEPVAYAELPGAPHAFDVFTSIRTVHTMRAVARFAEWAYQRFTEARSGGPASAPTDRAPRDPT